MQIDPPFEIIDGTPQSFISWQNNSDISTSHYNSDCMFLMRFFVVLDKGITTASSSPFTMYGYLEDPGRWWASFYQQDRISEIRILRDKTYMWCTKTKPLFKRRWRIRLNNIVNKFVDSGGGSAAHNSVYVVYLVKEFPGWGWRTNDPETRGLFTLYKQRARFTDM